MKTAITPSYVFTPSSGTLDLSSVSGFTVKRLYAVLNVTKGVIIYSQGSTTLGITSITGSVLTLQASVASMSSSDNLMIIYDVIGTNVTASSTPVTFATDDPVTIAIGTTADATWSGSGTGTSISLLKAIWTKLGSITLGAGSALIGSVTQSGAWTVSLNTGTNTIGSINPIGTLGTDHSANAPVVGNVLATGTCTRYFTAQNQSAATIQLILDDGASATPTILLLAPGQSAGAQGASSDPFLFAGRVRLAGPAGSQVSLRCW